MKINNPTRFETFKRLIESLELPEVKKEYLRLRWYQELVERKKKARRNMILSAIAGIIVASGTVLLPTLVTIKDDDNSTERTVGWFICSYSLLVGVVSVLERRFSFRSHWVESRLLERKFPFDK